MTDTYLSGGGVMPDQPLEPGTRITFRLYGSANEAIDVYVQDGVLHVVGQYRVIVTTRVEDNHLIVDTVPLFEE